MTNAQTRLGGLRPVRLDAVEQELDNLWRDTNAHILASADHGTTRNSVHTLVAFANGRSDADQLLQIVHTLTSQHPSRAIIVSADPRQRGNEMQGYIGTYIGQDGASYGEDILIEAHDGAVKHLPGVILPLIISGLPSFLWWTGEPPWGSELFEALVDGCDRLIVDTAEMPHTDRSLPALDDLQRRKGTRTVISDTGWTAQGPWRDVVAQFFDSAETRPYLDGIERVTIEYAAGEEDEPANSAQAYLMAGWLASRLGWRIQHAQLGGLEGSRAHTLRDGSGNNVAVEITARYGLPQRRWWSPEVSGETLNAGASQDVDREGRPWVRHGALMSVYLASRLSGQRATFTVARERDLAHVTTVGNVPGVSIPSQTLHLQSVGSEHPLSAQFQMLGPDTVYEEALSAAAHLIGGGRRGTR